MLFGSYLKNLNEENNLKIIEGFTSRTFDIYSTFWSWDRKEEELLFKQMNYINNIHKINFLTWEPWCLPTNDYPIEKYIYNTEFSLQKILNGKFDNYLYSWAKKIESLGFILYIRVMHEMNGNWYPWCGSVNHNSPNLYVETWKYIHGIFSDLNINNLKWVWCPYCFSVPNEDQYSIEKFYPGDCFVDYVGVDLYNWGTTQEWSNWTEFDELFLPFYKKIIELTNKKLIIAEVGCAETGGNKYNWIINAKDTLLQHKDDIHSFIWFSINKECDWRIDSSKESIQGFKELIESF